MRKKALVLASILLLLNGCMGLVVEKDALEKKYPIGSAAELLVRDLKNHGFYCHEIVGEKEISEASLNWDRLTKKEIKNIVLKGDNSKKIKMNFNEVICSSEQSNFLNSTYRVINIKRDASNKILKTTISNQYKGL